MKNNRNIDAFFALLRAGLWENSVTTDQWSLGVTENIDWQEVYQLAEEQSVIGVVLAGIERQKNAYPNLSIPQELLLQWIGEVQILEQHNEAMNYVIGELVRKMRANDIYTLLVKGQGIAQCYERPLWRVSGDIDFYLSDTNFAKAKAFFRRFVDSFNPDTKHAQHINMHYGEYVVEIHGNQHCSLSARIIRVMDEIHQDIFYGGNVRSWNDNENHIFLPSADNDALIVFVHFLNHFYKGGLGVRQICDWCRLLWTCKDSLDYGLLESRIRKMGLMNVWRGFAAFAVKYLGMPKEAIPLYNENDNHNAKLKRKAERIKDFIMMSGNFGHNRDMSYYDKYPYIVRKYISMGRRIGDLCRHAQIFPLDSIRFSFWILLNGVRSTVRGE